ncbi:MAG: hypothetical protein IJ493_04525 [Clostridia bacterium]|nr:hypothetical protein [Clostridia bacterium]
MKEKLRRFMFGRYGVDTLGYVLVFGSLVISFLSSLFGIGLLMLVSYAMLVWEIFRMMSRNNQARYRENAAFMKFWAPVQKWFKLQCNRLRDIRTHRYFSCPSCHNTLRVPKGKGEITITCPCCKTRFDKRT